MSAGPESPMPPLIDAMEVDTPGGEGGGETNTPANAPGAYFCHQCSIRTSERARDDGELACSHCGDSFLEFVPEGEIADFLLTMQWTEVPAADANTQQPRVQPRRTRTRSQQASSFRSTDEERAAGGGRERRNPTGGSGRLYTSMGSSDLPPPIALAIDDFMARMMGGEVPGGGDSPAAAGGATGGARRGTPGVSVQSQTFFMGPDGNITEATGNDMNMGMGGMPGFAALLGLTLPGGGGGGANTIGDYAFGDISTLIEQFMRNDGNRQGAPPAGAAEIAALPRVTITEGCDLHGKECTVCMEEFAVKDVVISMPCDHVFHGETCLLPWLTQHRTCPTCRAELVAARSQGVDNSMPSMPDLVD